MVKPKICLPKWIISLRVKNIFETMYKKKGGNETCATSIYLQQWLFREGRVGKYDISKRIFEIYLDLRKGAKWFLKCVNLPSLKGLWTAPRLEGAGKKCLVKMTPSQPWDIFFGHLAPVRNKRTCFFSI